jgi:hypothetical protein
MNVRQGLDIMTETATIFRASGLPGFRASGLPGFRASGLPGFRASGLPGFRASGLPGIILHKSDLSVY